MPCGVFSCADLFWDPEKCDTSERSRGVGAFSILEKFPCTGNIKLVTSNNMKKPKSNPLQIALDRIEQLEAEVAMLRADDSQRAAQAWLATRDSGAQISGWPEQQSSNRKASSSVIYPWTAA